MRPRRDSFPHLLSDADRHSRGAGSAPCRQLGDGTRGMTPGAFRLHRGRESTSPGAPRPGAFSIAGTTMTRIHMYDTTLRDGSQGEGVNFSLQDKLNITRRLDDLGVDFIEGGYPLSNPKDFEYFQEVRKLPLHHTKVVAFGMTRR